MSRSKILFALSGSIAAFKACQVLSQLVQVGHEVQTLCTPATFQFVGPATLEGLSGRPVLSDTFETGRQMDHIHLVDQTDLALLCPASADCLNRLSAGIGDSLLTTLLLAWDWKKPLLIAPAMNTRMWEHPATQDSVRRLRSWGAQFIEPQSGSLACGAKGAGRLAEVESLLEAVHGALKSTEGKRLLITAGGTRQPVDGVRELGNISTGRTASTLASRLAMRGHEITFLHSDQIPPPPGVKGRSFRSYEDLDQALQDELGSCPYDAVIHAAAVSDYGIESLLINDQELTPDTRVKIPSDAKLILKLGKKPKLLDKLRDYSCSPETRIVAFKLTQNAPSELRRSAATRLLKKADVVVQNDLSEITPHGHACTLYSQNEAPRSCTSKEGLADEIHHLLETLP